jgi:hypothetical protein
MQNKAPTDYNFMCEKINLHIHTHICEHTDTFPSTYLKNSSWN